MNFFLRELRSPLTEAAHPATKGHQRPVTEAAPLPDTLDPKTTERFRKLFNGGFRMYYRKGTKQITIFRFLIAKLVYSERGLGLEEFIALFDLLERLLGKTTTDKEFSEKYENWLITSSQVLKELQRQRVFPVILNPRIRKQVAEFLKPLLPSEHAYYGYVKDRKIMDSVRIKFRSPLIPEGKVPKPSRVIGVGYRDKGQLRNTAIDGSPRWQEVATARSFTELLEESANTISLTKIEKVPLTLEGFEK